MTAQQKSLLRVVAFDSIATPNDYAVVVSGVDLSLAPVGNNGETVDLSSITWEECAILFSDNREGSGGTAVLGVPDLADLLSDHSAEHMQAATSWVSAQVGGPQWVALAVPLWTTALDEHIIRKLNQSYWFSYSGSELLNLIDNKLNALRRTQLVDGLDAESSRKLCNALRKFKNLLGRNTEQADWVAEKHRRTVNTPVHLYPTADGSLSRTMWMDKVEQILKHFTEEVVSSFGQGSRLESQKSWWKSRIAWMPAGSSSNGTRAKKKIEAAGAKLDKLERANKKVTTALMAEDAFIKMINSIPAKWPRTSTKHEPGNKNRALYAEDDTAFLVASFASVGAESAISRNGIYAKQTPEDVATWNYYHNLYKDHGFFLSLDYADYNAEHESTALTMVDCMFARAWLKFGKHAKLGLEKARAAFWTALSHLNSWVTFQGDEEPTRILGGLFSGSRNTARDNCVLHYVYSQIMLEAANELIPTVKRHYIMMTGDDEDAAFNGWLGALAYVMCHGRAGFTVKPAKQMAGDKHSPDHEYLQRWLGENSQPTRPLPAALAQTLSGNWYKTNYCWLDALPNEVANKCWELHLRGLPLKTCQKMARKILNRTMVVFDSIAHKHVKLEWWSFRAPAGTPPIWGLDCTTPSFPATPSENFVQIANTEGSKDWIEKQIGRFPSLKENSRVLADISRSVNEDALGCLYTRAKNRQLHKQALQEGLMRVKKTPKLFPLVEKPKYNEKQLKLQLMMSAPKQVKTQRELIARFGVDSKVLEHLGGLYHLLLLLTPGELSAWENVVEVQRGPKWAWWLDPSIRAHINSLTVM